MIIEKIVLSKAQPRATNVLWLRPLGNGIVMYAYNSGAWQPIQSATTMESRTTDDDEIVNAGEILKITETIKDSQVSFLDSKDNRDYNVSSI